MKKTVLLVNNPTTFLVTSLSEGGTRRLITVTSECFQLGAKLAALATLISIVKQPFVGSGLSKAQD